MNAKLTIVAAALAALVISACGFGSRNLILGKWEVETAPMKMTAEFYRDGTAKMTMLGQTVRGTYEFNGDELVWSMNGLHTTAKVGVTASELELTDSENRTIRYRRK